MASKKDINVKVGVVVPERDGLKEIANIKTKVPNLTVKGKSVEKSKPVKKRAPKTERSSK